MIASTRSATRNAVAAVCKPYFHAIAIIVSGSSAAAKSECRALSAGRARIGPRGCARTKHACCAPPPGRACVSLRGCARTKHACCALPPGRACVSLRGCARTKHACCALPPGRACVSLRGCARTKHACCALPPGRARVSLRGCARPAGSICTAAETISGRRCRLTSGRGDTSRVGAPATSRVGRLVRIMHACFVGADRRARTRRHAWPTETISGRSGMSSGNSARVTTHQVGLGRRTGDHEARRAPCLSNRYHVQATSLAVALATAMSAATSSSYRNNPNKDRSYLADTLR